MSTTKVKNNKNGEKSGFDWSRFDVDKFFADTNRVAKFYHPVDKD